MNCVELQQLIRRCASFGIIDPNNIRTPLVVIAWIINITVEVVKQEQIEPLLAITTEFIQFPSADEATLITIGVSEQLMSIDANLTRWFLDILLRHAEPELRAEMAMAFEPVMDTRSYCFVY